MNRINASTLILLFCLTLLALPAHAAKRLALVVGNDAYQALPVLRKAVNDARAVTFALQRIGYQVITGENLTPSRDQPRKYANSKEKSTLAIKSSFSSLGMAYPWALRTILFLLIWPCPNKEKPVLWKMKPWPLTNSYAAFNRAVQKILFWFWMPARDNPFAAQGTRSIGGSRGLAGMFSTTRRVRALFCGHRSISARPSVQQR